MVSRGHSVPRLTGAVLLALVLGAGCGDRSADPRRDEIRQAIKAFSSDSPADRRRAAASLERLLPPASQAKGVEAEAIEQLRALVKEDRDDHVKAAAIRTLGKSKDEQSWEIIAELVNAEETQVRFEVLQALSSIDSGRAFPVLVQALGDPESAVRLVAASTLAGTEAGVNELKRRLEAGGADQAVLINGLESSPLPAAAQTLLAGLTSTNPPLRSAAIRKAGLLRHREAVPVLTSILGQDRRTGITDEDHKAAAESLVAIGGEEGMLPVLMSSHRAPWLNQLLIEHQAQLRPLLLSEAAKESGRRVPVEVLVGFLMRDPSPECVAALGALAAPDLPGLVQVCQLLRQKASAELRAKVASRLRGAVNEKGPEVPGIKYPRPASVAGTAGILAALQPDVRLGRAGSVVTALSLVGRSGDGPDATAAWELLRTVWDSVKTSRENDVSSTAPANGRPKTSTQRGVSPLEWEEELLCSAAEACGRLRVSAAGPVFGEMMRSEQAPLLAAGLSGAMALGDAASLDQVNQALLATKVHPYHLFNSAFGSLVQDCHDPRILPGLLALKNKGENRRIYQILAANGTPEAAAILMAELADPNVSLERKRDHLAPVMAGLGATGRPLFIRAMTEAPQPAKRGDPDVGWWCAEFLREQRSAAAPDVLAALARTRPSGWVAARYIHALDLADTPEAIASQTSWLGDADRDLANLALQSLVHNRRVAALPAIRAARDAAATDDWRDRLDMAIAEISRPVEKGSS